MGDGNIVRISNLYGGECRVVEILQWLENVHLTAPIRGISLIVCAATNGSTMKAKKAPASNASASAKPSSLDLATILN